MDRTDPEGSARPGNSLSGPLVKSMVASNYCGGNIRNKHKCYDKYDRNLYKLVILNMTQVCNNKPEIEITDEICYNKQRAWK